MVKCGNKLEGTMEENLTLFMQEMNSENRWNQGSVSYKQKKSTKVNKYTCILLQWRMWVEVNNHLNYPLKKALISMCDNDIIDMDDAITRHCTSQLCISLCTIGIERIIAAWTAHRIPGRVKYELE